MKSKERDIVEIVDNDTGNNLFTLIENDDQTYTLQDRYGLIVQSVSAFSTKYDGKSFR